MGNDVHLYATARGQGQVTLAGRDVHVHYEDAGQTVRRVQPGMDAHDCPYPGLAPFTVAQARWFFGRDATTARLTARLADRLDTGGPLVVVAPSGAGKSSLLRAGLLPAIARNALPVAGSADWPRLVCTPGARPLTALAAQVAELVGCPVDAEPARLVDALRDGLAARGVGSRVVLVIDQLEELFLLCPDERERHAFLDVLADIAEVDTATGRALGLVVYGLRMDAYGRCANYPRLRAALQDGQILLGPMSRDELRQAILFPARDIGLTVEPGLVDLLLRDLGAESGSGETEYETGRLPLLAHALRTTWQQRHGQVLTVEGYQLTGGITDAVAASAEDVFDRLSPSARQAARGVFLRLVRIGDDTADTRRTVARDSLLRDDHDPDTLADVVDAFTAGRLLTQERDTVLITHEVLLRAWPRLRHWIDDDRAGNLVRQRLEEAADGWQGAGRDSALLLRGGPLDTARTWVDTDQHRAELSPAAHGFYLASVRLRTRTRRRRRGLIALLCTLTVLATASAGYAFQRNSTAQAELRQVSADTLVATAQQVRAKNPWLAGQFDLAALRLRHESDVADQDPSLYTALVTDASTTIPFPAQVWDTDGYALMLDFDPNGLLAVGFSLDTRNNVIELWQVADPAHPTRVTTVAQPWAMLQSISFDPSGHRLAATYTDGSVRAWTVDDRGAMAGPTTVAAGQCGPTAQGIGCDSTVAFTDRDTLAQTVQNTPGGADSLSLRDLARPGTPILHTATGPDGGFLLVDADPVNHLLAVQKDVRSAPVRVWDVREPNRPRELAPEVRSPEVGINFAAFGPATHELASFPAGDKGGVQLWTVDGRTGLRRRGQVPTDNNAHNAAASVWYNTSGTVLAVLDDDDAEVHLFDVADPDRPKPLGAPFTAPPNRFDSAVLSPDGRLMASDDRGPTLRLWDLNVTEDIRQLCARPRVTEQQWRRYLPGIPFTLPCDG